MANNYSQYGEIKKKQCKRYSVSFIQSFLYIKCSLIYNKFTTQHCLSCIKAAHTIT